MKLFFSFLALFLFYGAGLGAQHAVIVAGSNGFYNYRHQADACHAFQILKARGVPTSNIIVMMYDDIANSSENPFPGQIFNKPTKGEGVDVYKGCQKDYTGEDVSPENFLAVLTGDASSVKGGNGRVLNSTSEDKVFINFVDHGGVGIIAFPNGDLLHADDLVGSLKTMHTKKMFKQLVFYMEACESGSMFEDLPDNISVFATTAANADQSSWGTYCPPQDSVNGKELGTCLGDLYSVNWMENTDSQTSMSETLAQQYATVKKETAEKSQVCEFGDQSFTSDPIGDFLGSKSESVLHKRAPVPHPVHDSDALPWAHIDSRDIKLHSLYYRYLRSTSHDERIARWEDFNSEVLSRSMIDEFFSKLCKKADPENWKNLLTSHTKPTKWGCIKALNVALKNKCGVWSDYGRKYHRVTVNLCEAGHSPLQLLHFISDMC